MTDLLTITDIATLAGLKPASVARYHHGGRMPPPDRVISRIPLWERDTVDGWLATKHRPGRPRVSSTELVAGDLGRSQGDLYVYHDQMASSTEPVVCTTPCGRCLPTSTETGVKRCRWEGAEYVEPWAICEHGTLARKCPLCELTEDRNRLANLLLQVPAAIQTEMGYEDWWRDVVDELEGQGIAKPLPPNARSEP